MQVIYENTDITKYVDVRECLVWDTAGERCDGLEMEFEDAESWFRWGVAEDDRIRVVQEGYDTGILYLNSVIPEKGKFRIYATSLPCAARKKQWKSFTEKSIAEIMHLCAMMSGMDYALHGISGGTVLPYIAMENESCAAFLARLLKLEGAVLKCFNGSYSAIGVTYAQGLSAEQFLHLRPSDHNYAYERTGIKKRMLTVKTPYATGSARDSAVGSRGADEIVCCLPARDDVTAARWARNMLLDGNRRCETLTVQAHYKAEFTAMTRLDISGETDATGQWVIDSVEHDLKDLKSTAHLHRCVDTIG